MRPLTTKRLTQVSQVSRVFFPERLFFQEVSSKKNLSGLETFQTWETCRHRLTVQSEDMR